jgi:hypothetical protein
LISDGVVTTRAASAIQLNRDRAVRRTISMFGETALDDQASAISSVT